MNQPWLKSALWTLSGIMLHVTLSPPVKITKNDDFRHEGKLMKFLLQVLPYIRGLQWIRTIFNILSIHPPTFLRKAFFPNPSAAATLDAKFLVAFIFLSLSFLLRWSSYRSLGDMFTFHVTIRPNHKLITDGPYRFVRHPSYTAHFGMVISNVILHFSMMEYWAANYAFWIWMTHQSVACVKLWIRTKREDEELRRRFGKEWVSYRERVQFRFVPGII